LSETLPEGWVLTTLGDLSDYVTSGSRDWSKYYSDRGALFIRTQDINKNRLATLDDIARVALPKQAEGKRTLVMQGDLLITITGANVGKCAYVDSSLQEAYVSQSVALVRLAEGFSGSFIHRHLISPSSDGERTPLQRSAYGVGRPVLNLDNVRDTPIGLAPLKEQERLVARIDTLMSQLDSARSHLSRVPALLERFRQAVLTAACSGTLTEDLGSRDLWTETTLGDSAIEIRTGPFGSALHKSDYIVDGIPVINPTNIIDGKIVPNQAVSISKDTFHRLEEYALRRGDIIIARRGEMGRCAVVGLTEEGWVCGTGSAILRLKPSAIPHFVQMFISSPGGRAHLSDGSVGSTMDNLNQKVFASMRLALPPIEEQKEIVGRIGRLFERANAIENCVAAVRSREEKLTQSILAKAFRGELVPTEAELARREGREYEPASVLLERIKAERNAAATPKATRPRILSKRAFASAKGS
jgi:type I restriction enzyme, S subunit